MAEVSAPFQIDFVGDVVCPWCFLGWARLKAALKARPDLDAMVAWRPYQLQFDIPEAGLPYAEFMAGLFPDGRWTTVSGAGHTVQGDNPQGFVDALRPFLAELPEA